MHTPSDFETGDSPVRPTAWRRTAGRRITVGLALAWLLLALASAGCASKNLAGPSEFQTLVLTADRPVLVGFYKGVDCPEFLPVSPILNQLAEEYQGRVAFARFDALTTPLFQVTSPPLAEAYDIAFFPTAVLFVNGQERARWIMDYDIENYRATLDAVLAAAPDAAGPEVAAGSAGFVLPGPEVVTAAVEFAVPRPEPAADSVADAAEATEPGPEPVAEAVADTAASVMPESDPVAVAAEPAAPAPEAAAEPAEITLPGLPVAAESAESAESAELAVASPDAMTEAAAEVAGAASSEEIRTAAPAQVADAGDPPEEIQFVLAKPRYSEPEPAASTAGPGEVAAATVPAAGPPVVLLADSVLAEVDGEVITLHGVLAPMQAEVQRWSRECTHEEFESRCRAAAEVKAREAVIHRLLVQEAKAQLSADEQQRLTAAVTGAGANPTSLLGSPGGLEVAVPPVALQSQNVKMEAGEWLLVQGFLREKIAPQVRVTQSELLASYRQVMQERYILPTKVRLGMIVIRKCDSATPEWAQSLANAVHSRASAGEDFAKLAQRYGRDASAAKGGDWGLIAPGSFEVKAVEDVLFSLAAGQVGPLLETQDAYYIVKALERQEGRTVPFPEVQSALEQELRDKKYNARVASYIQELYERWRGQYKTANLPAAPALAADQ